MKKILLLLLLLIGCIVVPIVIAALLSAVGGIGSTELGVLYLACFAAAILIWRSVQRNQARAH